MFAVSVCPTRVVPVILTVPVSKGSGAGVMGGMLTSLT